MSNPLKVIGTDFTATMSFSLAFNQHPNFIALDSNGRPQDSFQIYVAYDPATPNPEAAPNVVIRGDEIHIAHTIRIRDAQPAVADPHAGGWGAIRGTAAYHLRNEPNGTALLKFSVPFAVLGITGRFGWVVQTTNFGSQVDLHQGVSP